MEPSVVGTIDAVRRRLTRIQNDRFGVVELLQTLTGEIQKIKEVKSELLDSGDAHEMCEILDHVLEKLQSERGRVREWLGMFDFEIERIESALQSFECGDTDEVKRAFADFMLSDTGLSVKNNAMTFYDFREFLHEVHALVQEVKEREEE